MGTAVGRHSFQQKTARALVLRPRWTRGPFQTFANIQPSGHLPWNIGECISLAHSSGARLPGSAPELPSLLGDFMKNSVPCFSSPRFSVSTVFLRTDNWCCRGRVNISTCPALRKSPIACVYWQAGTSVAEQNKLAEKLTDLAEKNWLRYHQIIIWNFTQTQFISHCNCLIFQLLWEGKQTSLCKK